MATKCIKLEIKFNKENKILKTHFFKGLRDKQYNTYIACNKAMTMYYTKDMQERIQKDIGLPKQDDEEMYGKNFRSYVSNQIKEIMHSPSSYIVDEVSAYIHKKYSSDKKNGLLKGERSLATFKRDMPIMLRNTAYKISKEDNKYTMNLVLFTKEEMENFKVYNHKKGDGVLLDFVKPDASRRTILDRIISNEYKQGSIKIIYNERKEKWMAVISYTYNFSEIPNSSERINIMGVDLGIARVATLAVFNPVENEHKFINWNYDVLDGKKLIHFRQKVEARRREYGRATKLASANATGHGRKRRIQKVLELGDKIARFRDTANHTYSRYIVNQALKYDCGLIQMENLSGYADAAKSSFLKNWSYYDLQSKVEYKAKEAGIEVIFIDPKYTSQRCNKCGCIDSANRDCKNNQARFECISCGHKANADDNAARNIAMPNIEDIINDTIKENKKKKSKQKQSKSQPLIIQEYTQLKINSLTSENNDEIFIDEGTISFS